MTMPSWLVERLSLERFRAKYLGKAFPVHPTFFLGESALFCFAVLVATGLYLALFYEPSAQVLSGQGGSVPAAYASTLAIDSQPFGALVRRIHHWAAHLMIASIVLHLLRVFFTASYRKPRELNWVLGLVLLGATIAASFAGYLLPYDQFSVTATAIGYGIARSVPWVGPTVADFVFAGPFPSGSTVPRFYAYHVVWAPLVLSALIGLHLLVVLKQKHTELRSPVPPKGSADAALIHGIPLWPEQTALMGVLLLLIMAVLAALAAFLPVHPSAFYGAPQPITPEVKPDWYLLWVYGALRLIPGSNAAAEDRRADLVFLRGRCGAGRGRRRQAPGLARLRARSRPRVPDRRRYPRRRRGQEAARQAGQRRGQRKTDLSRALRP